MYGCDYDDDDDGDDGKRVRAHVFGRRDGIAAPRSFLYEMRFCQSIFSQNVYLNSNKRQIPFNVEFEVKKKNQQQQRQTAAAAVVFGKQTNNTCAVPPKDRANKQTASEPNNILDAAIHVSLIHQFSARRNLYTH